LTCFLLHFRSPHISNNSEILLSLPFPIVITPQASIGAAGRPLTLTLSRPTVATLAKIAKAHKKAAIAVAAAENPDGSNLTGGPYGEGIQDWTRIEWDGMTWVLQGGAGIYTARPFVIPWLILLAHSIFLRPSL